MSTGSAAGDIAYIAGVPTKVGRRGSGRRGEGTPAARPCSFEMSCSPTKGTIWLVGLSYGTIWLVNWPYLKLTLGRAKLQDGFSWFRRRSQRILTNAPLSGFSWTTKDQQVAAIKQVNVEFCILICLQFITRKVTWKPFNIITSCQLKPSTLFTSPFQVLVLLSTFKTVTVSPSVIVSSIIRQSFIVIRSVDLSLLFNTQRWTDSTPWLCHFTGHQNVSIQ